jgi:tetratricopeptide (TPR) repeat protein
LIAEPMFWQLAGLVESQGQVKRLYTAAMLAELLGVPPSTIRRWHRRGLITPVQKVHRLPYYDFQEVTTARRLAQLIQSGASPAAIEAKLSALAQWFPDVQRPLTQLSIIVEGKDVLLRRGEGLIEPNGQRRIDFAALDDSSGDAGEEPNAAVLSGVDFTRAAIPVTFDEHQRLATALEDEGRLAEALQVYRGMLLGFGPSAEVNFAVAELLYLLGELDAARERYFCAVELDPDLVEARASLGCLLVELGEPETAVPVFEGALSLYQDYADVHFHLARTLDGLNRAAEAVPHWQRFLELSPASPWADEARERLCGAGWQPATASLHS